jgi:hypothetical protein
MVWRNVSAVSYVLGHVRQMLFMLKALTIKKAHNFHLVSDTARFIKLITFVVFSVVFVLKLAQHVR